MINAKTMSTYLEDHLTGATLVIELVDRRRKRDDVEAWMHEFHAQLLSSRRIVQSLADQFSTGASHIKQAAGWAAEKAAQVKLALDGDGNEDLRDLLELETMRTGVEGQKCLWRSLQRLDDERVGAVDIEAHLRTADEQADTLEQFRLDAAVRALT